MPKLTQMFEILSKARALVAKCQIIEAPVDLAKLARHQRIREIRVDNSVLNGELRRLKSGGYLVRLDGRDSEERRRFTLAHEIAHTFLHTEEGGNTIVRCDNTDVENLCNLAGAELLIPDTLFRRRKFSLDIESILRIAREFRCSLEAAAWKLLNSADYKGALLIWNIRRIPPRVVARLVSMPRTLTVQLPFARGATISDSDPNWSSIATSRSKNIELRSFGGVYYSAERKQLGKSTIAILIRLSKTSAITAGAGERQALLFQKTSDQCDTAVKEEPTQRDFDRRRRRETP
jgi:hypothetical protein